MRIDKFEFNKKCDFDLCQNSAQYVLHVGAKGDILFCKDCLTKLKKNLKVKNGEENGEN